VGGILDGVATGLFRAFPRPRHEAVLLHCSMALAAAHDLPLGTIRR